MSGSKMHLDELEIDVALVRRLVAAQAPAWAALPIERVSSAGTDNAMFRLGAEMAVRLPRIERAVNPLLKEQAWLPRLGPHLPLDVPVPLAAGVPAEGYPWPWLVYSWLEGTAFDVKPPVDLCQTASRLGRFVKVLHGLDTSGGPAPGDHNFWRGEPLVERDAETRAGIEALGGVLDETAVTEAWGAALSTRPWDKPPVWVHGDLLPGNLLGVSGRVSAVIDFGGLGVGDPACDMMIAWALFSDESRQIFRETVGVDEETWARGRGWALSWALIYIPYYLNTNSGGVKLARRTIEEVLRESV